MARLGFEPRKVLESAAISRHSIPMRAHPTTEGMRRELEEEINIDCKCEVSLAGLINDDENDVGKVHLGIVHIFAVDEPKVSAREAEISEAGFLPVSDILSDLESFETWSQICLKALFGS